MIGMNWEYAPESDSDGFTIGVDHFVIDSEGNQIACAPDEPRGRLIAAAPRMLAALESLTAPGSGASMHGDTWAKVQVAIAAARGELG